LKLLELKKNECEVKTCKQRAEDVPIQNGRKLLAEADRIVEEAGADLVGKDTEEISTTSDVGKTETVSEEENDKESTTSTEHPESESEDSTDEKDDDVVSAVNVMKVKAIALNRRFHWPQLFQ
jgi:phosphopantothenoylcysteine synthetase/decarboxylase